MKNIIIIFILAKGVATDPSKLAVIQDWLLPFSFKEL